MVFFLVISSTTETLSQSESFQPGPIHPGETEAKVRTFTRGWEGTREATSCSQLYLHQSVLEGDSPGMEAPAGDTAAQGDLDETPVAADLGPDPQDLEDQSLPQSLPSSPKAGKSPSCLPLSLSF